MVVDGERHGEVHWIRDDRRGDRVYRSAVWQLRDEDLPYESPYHFRQDETFCVLEGELTITFDDGSVVTVRQGDILAVAGGTNTVWHVTVPFKKFVVEA
jgi:uncharacterized cupin superfamily protein